MRHHYWQRVLLILAGGFVISWFMLTGGPAYFADPGTLAALIGLELIFAAVWNYRSAFFLVLLGAFVWAGVALPFNTTWTTARWFVLGIAALVGCVLYLKNGHLHITFFHFAAFTCAATAIVSAAISDYPQIALFKAVSLSLLFIYGATGARIAAAGRERQFLSGLLICSEALVYVSAVAYFVFHYRLLGNPNSEGAVMGVVAVPLLLWQILRTHDRFLQSRFVLAFVMALLLLFSSYARAGIMAAAISSLLLCVTLRRYRTLMKGACLALLLAPVVATFMPRPNQPSESLSTTFIFKGRRDQGLLASRKSVWDETVAVIEAHPWLGVGFGTSKTSDEEIPTPQAALYSEEPATREHGNSYLAITEWVGLVGGIPFLVLLAFVANNITGVMIAVRRSGHAAVPAVPIATLLVAGLVDAAFEDWLFAVGYYLCILFWSLAFILVDLDSRPLPEEAVARLTSYPVNYQSRLSPARHASVS